jgi:hypothetical protein
MNLSQVSKISLNREVVDCIVFWTKNPESMLPKLSLIDDYNYYFQFTLNPYDADFETDVPRKASVIDTFKRLSDKIGPQRIIWRYDPIIINNSIDIEYHEKYFDLLAKKLHKHTAKCIISFVDNYRKTGKAFKVFGIQEIDDHRKRILAQKISEIARHYNLKIETCAEDIDLSDLGIEHARCIDPYLIENILGVKINCQKDLNQRKPCGCINSIDIGAYNTCAHGCIYCYASHSKDSVRRNIANYDVNSPLLCSKLMEEDKVTEREMESCAVLQKSIFET